MAVVRCMDGDEEFKLALDEIPSIDDLWNVECIAIEKAIGAIGEDTPRTEILSGIVWVLARRERRGLRWSDFQFRMGDVTALLDTAAEDTEDPKASAPANETPDAI